MRFTPHKPYQRYKLPVFIIHASDRLVTIRTPFGDTTVTLLDEWYRSGLTIYSCVSPDSLLLYGKPERWQVRTWNGRIASMSYADVKVYPLLSDGWDDSILTLFDYIDSHGIAASSLNTMSLNLWRTTLSAPVYFHEESPLDDMLGPVAALCGGRKEALPGVYRNRENVDIIAAYPTALSEGIPPVLHPAPEEFVKRMDIDKFEGLAKASVRIPTLKWGPIPVIIDVKAGITSYGFTRSNEWVTVILPLSELRFAHELGADMVLHAVRIAPRSQEWDSFSDWGGNIVPELRSLPLLAGTLGKLIANRLWSCFAVSPYGVRKDHRFTEDGTMTTAECPPDSMGQVKRRAATTYVGAMVQARVREKLYREGLSLPGVVYVDTDGVVAKHGTKTASGWRVKEQITWCDIAGPQAMVYRCNDCGKPGSGRGKHDSPHWTVAGATTVEAKSALFRQIKEGATFAFSQGNVIPPCDVVEARAHAKEVKEAGGSEALQYLQAL